MRNILLASIFALGAVGCGGGGSPEDLCKKMGELAEKEGGKALERYNRKLKDDCPKELGEMKEKLGENFPKFAECVNGAKDFSSAYKDCSPRKFMKKDDKKEEK